MSLSLIVFILFSFSSHSSTSKTSFIKDELQIKLKNISSVLKSSKKKYAEHYLFIAEVDALKVSTKNESKEKEMKVLLKKGDKVEILAHKTICYDEVYTAIQIKQGVSLSLSNLKLVFFKEVKDKKYKGFMKVDILKNQDRTLAGCALEVK